MRYENPFHELIVIQLFKKFPFVDKTPSSVHEKLSLYIVLSESGPAYAPERYLFKVKFSLCAPGKRIGGMELQLHSF
jgi:hypothetical protein